jgi:hypothetical protein
LTRRENQKSLLLLPRATMIKSLGRLVSSRLTPGRSQIDALYSAASSGSEAVSPCPAACSYASSVVVAVLPDQCSTCYSRVYAFRDNWSASRRLTGPIFKILREKRDSVGKEIQITTRDLTHTPRCRKPPLCHAMRQSIDHTGNTSTYRPRRADETSESSITFGVAVGSLASAPDSVSIRPCASP